MLNNQSTQSAKIFQNIKGKTALKISQKKYGNDKLKMMTDIPTFDPALMKSKVKFARSTRNNLQGQITQ